MIYELELTKAGEQAIQQFDKAHLPNAQIIVGANKTAATTAVIKYKSKLNAFFKQLK